MGLETLNCIELSQLVW